MKCLVQHHSQFEVVRPRECIYSVFAFVFCVTVPDFTHGYFTKNYIDNKIIDKSIHIECTIIFGKAKIQFIIKGHDFSFHFYTHQNSFSS